MLGENKLWVLVGVEAAAAVIAGQKYGVMTGFWTFTSLVVATALIFAGMNYTYTRDALGASPSKVGTIALLVIITLGLIPLYTSMFDFPQSASIILAASTTLSLGWAHTTLEPSGPA